MKAIQVFVINILLLCFCECFDEIVKCCDPDQGLKRIESQSLSNFTYECISTGDVDSADLRELHPLKLGKYDSIMVNRFPENCTEISEEKLSAVPENYCVDKVISVSSDVEELKDVVASVIVLGCDDSQRKELSLRTVFKCCSDGMVFDLKKHVCVEAEGNLGLFEKFVKNQTDLVDIRYGIACKGLPIIYDFDNVEGTFELRGDVLLLEKSGKKISLEPGSFCLDDSKDNGLIARGCRTKCDLGPCVGKCCGDGMILRSFENCSKACVPSDVGLSVSFYRVTGVDEPVAAEAAGSVATRPGVVCGYGKYKLEAEHFVDVITGGLYVPEIGQDLHSGYCNEIFDNKCDNQSNMTMITLMCFPAKEETVKNNDKMEQFSYGLIVSCVFLAATLIVYAALPQLRNFHGKTIMCHVTAMLIAYSSLARVQLFSIHGDQCKVLGYVIYYSFLAAFSWLNVMCFDIWWTFGNMRNIQGLKRNSNMKRFLLFSLYAWGLPALLTLSTYMFDEYKVAWWLAGNIGASQCWFALAANKLPWLILFILPIGIQISINCVLFVLTALHCNKVKSEIHRMQAGSKGDTCRRRFLADKAIYVMNIKLFVVMGMSWILEIISSLITSPLELWYIADCINVLQGIPIFCILILKRKVFILMKKRLGFKHAEKRSDATMTTGFTNGTSDAVRKSLPAQSIALLNKKPISERPMSH